MATVAFTTAPTNGGANYQITDQSTGVGDAGFLEKRVIVIAADNTVLYDEVTPYTETVLNISTSTWLSHLAFVQITVQMAYRYDSLQSVFLLPTTLNIRQ